MCNNDVNLALLMKHSICHWLLKCEIIPLLWRNAAETIMFIVDHVHQFPRT